MSRRRERAKVEKRPRMGVQIDKTKRAFTLGPTRGESEDHLAWRFGQTEMDGPWGWTSIDGAKARDVYQKLVQYEKRTWAEAHRSGSAGVKAIPTGSICPDAQRRLEVLKLDDVDELVEFRLSARERAWGIRLGNVCYVLWWDPEHQVCPSTKHHT